MCSTMLSNKAGVMDILLFEIGHMQIKLEICQ
jgi:hypothetical protein